MPPIRTEQVILYGFHRTGEADPSMVASLLGIDGDESATLPEAAAKTTDARPAAARAGVRHGQAEPTLDQIDWAWAFSPVLAKCWPSKVGDMGRRQRMSRVP
jgi:hypothetical protein